MVARRSSHDPAAVAAVEDEPATFETPRSM